MDATLLTTDGRTTAGVLLLSIVAIEFGGLYVLKIVTGREPRTEFQLAFARAGHAHAGVLVTLSLVCLVLVDAAGLSGLTATLGRSAIPLAAILMPVGFFFSSAGRGATEPNRWIVLLYAGAASLALGVAGLGIGLLTS
ncbi:MAG: hypothetical protein ACR2LG_06025 [Actinomycetota bacterium]|nr:hypothetical protein [Actinomycetota bacterium]